MPCAVPFCLYVTECITRLPGSSIGAAAVIGSDEVVSGVGGGISGVGNPDSDKPLQSLRLVSICSAVG